MSPVTRQLLTETVWGFMLEKLRLITNILWFTLSLITTPLIVTFRVRQWWNEQIDSNCLKVENNWQSLVQMSGCVLIGLSPSYRVLVWNREAEKLYDRQQEEVLQKNYLALLPETVRDTFAIDCHLVMAQKTSRRSEHSVLSRDGREYYVMWSLSPWLDSQNNLIGIIVSGHDITEIKNQELALLEEKQSALKTCQFKSEFFTQMSHEIRTPINGVLGMVELLQRTNLNSQQQDYACTISHSAKHLLNIVNNILDLSKLEAGKTQLEQLDFDLDECLSTVVEVVAAKAETKDLELAILIDSDLPRQLKGDVVRLRQILLNLLDNAIKFTAQGNVVIHVLKELETDQSIKIRFVVEDTGIGIESDKQQQLFKPFTQVSFATTRQYGGTGLGLSICQQFVKLMGGEIGLESTFGKGSTFWFTAEFDFPQKRTTRVPAVLNNLKLLVVDSSALVRLSVLNLAQAWKINVTVADTAQAALKAWQTAVVKDNSYDLVLVEESLLNAGSAELVRMMHQNCTLAGTKVILMSRMKQRQRVEQLMKLGDFGYLVKPITPSRLLNSLIEALEIPSVTQSLAVMTNSVDDNSSIKILCKPDAVVQNNVAASILLAEDDPVNQQVITGQLKLLGYQVDCVVNGQEVLEQMTQKDYDLILMDSQMPVLNGYETTKSIRRNQGSSQHTIILAMTASALPSDRDKCLEAGMDDYISKPIELEALGAILRRWVNLIKKKDLVHCGNTSADNNTLITYKPDSSTELEISHQSNCPIDLERLKLIFNDKIEPQQKILQIFIEQTRLRIEAIRQALTIKDFATIKQQAHLLKGAGSNIGVLNIPEMAQHLEDLANEQSLGESWELVEMLDNCYAKVKVFLDSWISQRKQ